MVSKTAIATEEAGSVPAAPDELAATAVKEPTRGFLRSARQDLSEEDLSTPAARRFLLAEIERLDNLTEEQKFFVQKYYDQKVEIASLTVGAEKSKWIEVLSSVCLAVGCAGVGAAPSYISLKDGTVIGLMIMGFSVILVIIGIVPKVVKWS